MDIMIVTLLIVYSEYLNTQSKIIQILESIDLSSHCHPLFFQFQVDFEGNVLNTHQFKQLLAVPPTPVIRLEE